MYECYCCIFRCRCLPGYTGVTCDTIIPQCLGVTCNDRGTCMADGAGYVCDCEAGFTGTHCENTTCGEGTCQNSGVCHLGGCLCKLGYTGDICLTGEWYMSLFWCAPPTLNKKIILPVKQTLKIVWPNLKKVSVFYVKFVVRNNWYKFVLLFCRKPHITKWEFLRKKLRSFCKKQYYTVSRMFSWSTNIFGEKIAENSNTVHEVFYITHPLIINQSELDHPISFCHFQNPSLFAEMTSQRVLGLWWSQIHMQMVCFFGLDRYGNLVHHSWKLPCLNMLTGKKQPIFFSFNFVLFLGCRILSSQFKTN